MVSLLRGLEVEEDRSSAGVVGDVTRGGLSFSGLQGVRHRLRVLEVALPDAEVRGVAFERLEVEAVAHGLEAGDLLREREMRLGVVPAEVLRVLGWGG